MPTYVEQISSNVDRLIAEGSIESQYRDQYVDLFTKNPKAQERFATVLSMDQDYTRKSQANAQWRREQDQQLAQERQRIQAEEQRLRAWEQQANAEIAELRSRQMTPEIAARLSSLETVAANYNLGEAVTAPPVTLPTIPQRPAQGASTMPNQPVAPTGDYLSRDEAVGALRDMTSLYSQALMVSNEHFGLFGKPLNDDLISESLNTGRSVRELYDAKYNPSGRRAELDKQNRDAEIAKMRADITEEVRAQYATDPSRYNGPQPYGEPAQNQFFELAQSRAQVGADGKPLAAAPEMQPLSVQQINRVKNATEHFYKTYNPDGTRRTGGGPAQGF